ncbi:phosphoadenosine phosphosulfate reductase [Roseivivax marinus]|uniref:Adenosine 5'-phosphosulfate reductase n=1 Tax=Roseivivax marinus TaxID=1379903 RepID=W4HK92_9RHOB|nr:phosphoadenylyl-sulfate reductase [Roseivivax marinus]ETW12546.1 phosphoadenosine phosphosulfate reductase [Roseivivax marinus]UMA65860.1 phosphoadenylyl-sulfate reductase [Roseivivax marinus]SEL14019.1 phosphoadenylylsulfate reductase (thioredoxin) [Roseivivax marinus]
MRHETVIEESARATSPPDLDALRERVAALNARYRHHGATDVLRGALNDPEAGDIAMVSSFGAESVALLHLVAVADRSTPVLFIDTRLLFEETLTYQQEVAQRLGLRDVRVLRTDAELLAERDPYGALRFSDTDACCHLRKTVPLERALDGFDGWITGRKRYQSAGRADLDFFELEEATGRIKVNPLVHWQPDDVRAYMDENRLPRHPLVSQGYPSIGCWPCTSRVADGEDPRAGRWRGEDKDECGIHFVNGRAIRQGDDT